MLVSALLVRAIALLHSCAKCSFPFSWGAPPPRPPNKSAWNPLDLLKVPNFPNPAAGEIVYTSRFTNEKPESCNGQVYNFHASESLDLSIFEFVGRDEGKGVFYEGKLHFARGCSASLYNAF